MTDDDLWNVVEAARRALPGRPDAEDVIEKMTELLAELPPAEIAAYQQPLWDLMARSYRDKLWAAAYVVNGGASDDGFDYFRGWLIAQGRAVFEQAITDPDSLAGHPEIAEDVDEVEAEDMLNVVHNAYRQATGGEPPEGGWTINYPDIEFAWDFDDEVAMRRHLPRLTALYYD
ncbi:DUF4240 domain-containing protein [Micromonosporaceae bacterium Da 78-11]